MTDARPIALYVHFPWCVAKCPYCDFNSHPVRGSLDEAGYLAALERDLADSLAWLDQASGTARSISSVFFGGGTPSLFQPTTFAKLVNQVEARLTDGAEITMEANPGTVEAEKFNGFYQAGVNRISIGVQSFNDIFLKTLGRIHQSDEALKAFEIARQAGFKNINIDLMYALPEQTIEQALSDLTIATSLQPEHLSWYQLTLEPNTAFYHTPPKNMASDDLLADIGEAGLEFLTDKNYQRYEVSASYTKVNAPKTLLKGSLTNIKPKLLFVFK